MNNNKILIIFLWIIISFVGVLGIAMFMMAAKHLRADLAHKPNLGLD